MGWRQHSALFARTGLALQHCRKGEMSEADRRRLQQLAPRL
jgi:hypothetical protein